MGLGLSIDTYIDEDPKAPKALMLLSYEKQSLKPISFTDFIENPLSFSNPLVLIEPTESSAAPIVESTIHNIPFAEKMKLFHQNFKMQNVKFETMFLWIFVPCGGQISASTELIQFLKTAPISKYCSKSAVDYMDVFLDCPSSLVLRTALKPPSSVPAVRSCSPIRTAGQMCGTSNLLFRRSLNVQSLVSSPFRLPPIQQTQTIKEEQFVCPVDEMNEIVDGIFIGSERAASNKEKLMEQKITHIVNLSGQNTTNKFPQSFTYFTVNMRDNDFDDLPQDFWEALKFLHSCKANGHRVLVHCRMGICRSAALVAAFLSEENNITIDAAILMIKSKRPNVNINPGFIDQLHAHEEERIPPRPRSKPRLLLPTNA